MKGIINAKEVGNCKNTILNVSRRLGRSVSLKLLLNKVWGEMTGI